MAKKYYSETILAIPKEGKLIPHTGYLKGIIAAFMIYFMIFPMIFLDVSLRIYQRLYFTVLEIPKIPRREYVVIDRLDLSQLTFIQKINCVYCGYVNGISNWGRAIAAQTEIYSCGIQHKVIPKGQDHQKEFYEYERFK